MSEVRYGEIPGLKLSCRAPQGLALLLTNQALQLIASD